MAEPTPPAGSPPAAATAAPTGPIVKPPKPVQQNRAMQMLGLPALPRKLPSRNWMIFWTLSIGISTAIIYDKREKKRATARWKHAVEHLAREPLTHTSEMPRKLTIYLEAPPGDGLRIAQDHFTEYVKPILAASGLDWDFVQGRQQGDVRAVVAERIRRARRSQEGNVTGEDLTTVPTDEDIIQIVRTKNGIREYDGVRGDIVIGRHTWKEYIRGLHEGWLGPLKAPPKAVEPTPEPTEEGEEDKSKRPPQPKPYNSVEDYPTAHPPMLIPSELAPATPISFPHILGFTSTPIRLRRFFTRRYLADDIGREVAAACFATYREFHEGDNASQDEQWEQQIVLAHEEKDWLKSVWKEDEKSVMAHDASPTSGSGDDFVAGTAKLVVGEEKTEKIWPKPIVLDPRIAMRMRRFELQPEDEERARKIVVPETEVEGVIKGTLRDLWRWSAKQVKGEPKKVILFDDE